MRRLLIVIALAAATLVPASALTASAAEPDHVGIGVRLVDAPAATRDDPRARIYIIDHVAPGTLIERRIQVANGSGDGAKVEVYAAGATLTSGSFVGLEGKTPNEVSTWTTLDQDVLELSDGATAMVNVTIRVPADAAPGERYAALWAQTRSGTKDASGVTQVSRVGVRVYLSVGPGGAPASDFEITSLTPARTPSGHPMLTATVSNTGGRALDLSGSLKLTDGPGGLSAGPFPVTLGTTLAVGEAEPVNIEMDKQLPDGPWRAKVVVTSGLLTHSAQATITFPDAGVGDSVPPDTSSAVWWIGGAVLAALVLALLGWSMTRRQRARRRSSGARRAGVAYS